MGDVSSDLLRTVSKLSQITEQIGFLGAERLFGHDFSQMDLRYGTSVKSADEESHPSTKKPGEAT